MTKSKEGQSSIYPSLSHKIAQAGSHGEIAATLVVGVSTVKAHINSIFGKLDVTNRTHNATGTHAADSRNPANGAVAPDRGSCHHSVEYAC